MLGDAGVASLQVFGPPGTADFVRSLTRFVLPRTLVVAGELSGEQAACWRGVVDVFALPLTRDAPTRAADIWLAQHGNQLPRRPPPSGIDRKRRRRGDGDASSSDGSSSSSDDSSSDEDSSDDDEPPPAAETPSNGVDSSLAEFEAMLKRTHLSELLIRRARADPQLRHRLIEQWKQKEQPPAKPPPPPVPLAPPPAQPLQTAPAASNGNSAAASIPPIELLRLPWAAEPSSATAAATATTSEFALLCVPSSSSSAGPSGALLLSTCMDDAQHAALQSHPLLRCLPTVSILLHCVPLRLIEHASYQQWARTLSTTSSGGSNGGGVDGEGRCISSLPPI